MSTDLPPNRMKLAAEPFEFKKCLFVPQPLGLRAATLEGLLRMLTLVDETAVYYHLHHPYVSRVDVRPDFPGGFTNWVGRVLGELALAERLAALDPLAYSGRLEDLRRDMCRCVSGYLVGLPDQDAVRRAPKGREFAFCATQLVIIGGTTLAHDLRDLRNGVATCGSMCIFFHMFDTLRRSHGARNDFSAWASTALQDEPLARELAGINPYDCSVEETRWKLLMILDRHLEGQSTP